MRPRRRSITVALHFWVGNHEVQRWIEETKIFFVLALGRSGTRFVSELLKQDPAAEVHHEPVREDRHACAAAWNDSDAAARYIATFRQKEIFLRARSEGRTIYGEVNSLLRRHVEALEASFPEASLIHLVRDGRDVVRSMMARRTMRPDERHTAQIMPHEGDPWHEEWPRMDRFARLCWYWQVENSRLLSTVSATIQLERVLNSWEFTRDHLLAPCGITLEPAQWRRAVDRPANPTTLHAMPPWPQWTAAERETFRRICGPTMRRCGYELDDEAHFEHGDHPCES